MNIHELVRLKGQRLNLSPRTIHTYQHCLKKFFRTTTIDPIRVKKSDIERYIHSLIKNNRASSTINVYLSALKFFFSKVLNRKLTLYISLQKKVTRLPEFLTQSEVQQIFNAIQNPKHLLMIKVMYSSGIRVSELTNLKVKNLQLDQSYLWVRQGKGRKDRATIISKSLIEPIKQLIQKQQLKPENYLFSPYSKINSYNTNTIRAIIKKAQKSTKIHKNIHPHSFRHSFATHLIEQGSSVTEVQPLLGHTRIQTTMIYTHLARPKLLHINSPLDNLKNNRNI
jgi:integrase/recombinase XerD